MITPSLTRLLACYRTHLFTHALQSLTHSLNHSLACSIARLLASHSPTPSLTWFQYWRDPGPVALPGVSDVTILFE